MLVQTNRFGPVECDGSRAIHFARGILGFPKYKNYVLIQPEANTTFFWLQSVDAADLAFVVADPTAFVPDYHFPLHSDVCAELGVNNSTEADVLVIVNKVGKTLTANLQGPLVIHASTRAAAQIVLGEKRYKTRHVIADSTGDAGASK